MQLNWRNALMFTAALLCATAVLVAGGLAESSPANAATVTKAASLYH